jgi:hypothetical protein
MLGLVGVGLRVCGWVLGGGLVCGLGERRVGVGGSDEGFICWRRCKVAGLRRGTEVEVK